MNDDERPRGLSRDFVLIGCLALALVGLAWLAGLGSGIVRRRADVEIPADVPAPADFDLYGEAWSYIDREFYGKRPPPAKVAEGAVDGLVEALDDPWALYVPPPGGGGTADGIEPVFAPSLGIWVDPIVNVLVILSVLPGSPADDAGLVAGERLLAVDQDGLGGLAPDAMIAVVRDLGPEPVAVIVQARDGTARSAEVTAGAVPEPGVTVDHSTETVPVLQVGRLDPAGLAGLDTVLRQLADAPATGLVLDLRDNPGGDLDTLLDFAGRFMSGTVWIEVDRDGTTAELEALRHGAPDFDVPDRFAVLVDDGTVGSAEILAAALRDVVGARLVGTPTFGKQTVQHDFWLSDGSVVRLTTGTWRTASGAEMDESGLVPDVPVAADADPFTTAVLAVSSDG